MSPVQPSHPQLAVSAAIFRDDKILLVRRARSPAKGFYSLPGGRVEFGESLHTALHTVAPNEIRMALVDVSELRDIDAVRSPVVEVVTVIRDFRNHASDCDLKDMIHQVVTQHPG